MAVKIRIPDLPVEIIQKSINQIWLSPLLLHDRITLIRTSYFVSKRWATLFEEIETRDVFIVSPSHARRFIFISTSDANTRCIPNYFTCRSITFQHRHKTILPLPSTYTELHMVYAVNELLHHLCFADEKIGLRSIGFQLEIYLMESFFLPETLRFFPSQVTDLEPDFHYPADIPPRVLSAIRCATARRYTSPSPGSLPNIGRLRVTGSSQSGVMVLAEACSNMEWSKIEQDVVRSDRVLEMPSSPAYFVCESIR